MYKIERQGFTLVEMAIVLTIIGLVIGAIIVAQSLIKQSKISNLIAQVSKYSATVNVFAEKYGQLPGDINNASAYKLNCPHNTATCDGTTDNVAATTWDADADGSDGDGDGDGSVEVTSVTYRGEVVNFWVHLSNAQMVEGNYTQTDNCTAACLSVPGTNIPEATLGVAMLALTNPTDKILYFIAGTRGNYTSDFDTEYWENGSLASGDLLPADAQQIDRKTDDGLPLTGKVKALFMFPGTFSIVDSTYCTNGAAQYNITATEPMCTLVMAAK